MSQEKQQVEMKDGKRVKFVGKAHKTDTTANLASGGFMAPGSSNA